MSLKDNTTTKPTTQILMHGLPMVSAELYERERDKVRVMRETLEELLAYVETGYGDFGSDEGAQAHVALATTEDV
jgi:hypothetical protein